MESPTIPIENSRQVMSLVVAALCIFIPSVLVALRCMAKHMVTGTYDGSDLCILVALVFNVGLHVDTWIMVFKGGFGLNANVIVQRFGAGTVTTFYKCLLAFPLFWNITLCFSKISVLLMYIALMPVETMIRASRIIEVFIILWNTGGFFGGLFICWPIAMNWDRTIQNGHCGDEPLYYFILGIINVVTDFVIICLPMPFLYKLRLAWPKKLFAMGMFSIGFITISITIYRQTMLPHMNFSNMPYSGLLPTMFSGIEPAVAIVVACVPLLRPLIKGRASRRATGFDSSVSRSNTKSNSSRHFQELADDSSEIQLQPVGVKRDVTITGCPSASRAGQQGRNTITVEKRWEIKSEEERSHSTIAGDSQ